MIDAIDVQARACLSLGSTMYHDLLLSIRSDYLASGITYKLLHGVSERPLHDATPLRLLGALHRIVLKGLDPHLAQHYESVGGSPSLTLSTDALAAIESHFDEVSLALHQHVQTNEPGRSLCHLAVSHWLSHLGIRKFALLEVGASAGLTMSFDRYRITTPFGVVGNATSSLELPNSWVEEDFPFHHDPAQCVARRGVDVSPIDVTTDDGVYKLLSFVWPDQHERLGRLRAAIEITRVAPHSIDTASVDTWLPQQLHSHRAQPTMVFHSIVWQYLGPRVQNTMRDALASYGKTASSDTPLLWVRMEPAGHVADIQATIWDGSPQPQQWHLGTIGYHGQSLRWKSQRIA